VPWCAVSTNPRWSRCAPVKLPFRWAEQLAFQQVGRHRAAMDRHDTGRRDLAPTLCSARATKLFAGTGRPQDHDAEPRRPEAPDQMFAQMPDRRGMPNDAQIVVGRRGAAQSRYSCSSFAFCTARPTIRRSMSGSIGLAMKSQAPCSVAFSANSWSA